MKQKRSQNIITPNSIFPLLIIIIPIIGYWFFCSFLKPISPYYQDYDPEFQYFLNSLAILRGGSYTYIDHPGTPLEIIGSLILLATRLFLPNSQGNFTLYHLQHPELFMGVARGIIVLLSLSCALFFFYSAKSSAKSSETMLLAPSLTMMFFAIHPDAFKTLTLWSHNSFNFALGTFLLVILFNTLKQPGEIRRRKIICIGLGIGFLAAITIYFATWVLGAEIALIISYRLQKLPWKSISLAALLLTASSLAGFFLATLPILNLYPVFAGWISGLFFHQGIYGSGAAGITSLSLFETNLFTLIQDLPVLFVTLAIETLLIIYISIRWQTLSTQKPGHFGMTAGMASMLLLLIIAIAKHPKDIYMLAIAAILPVLLLVILDIPPLESSFYKTTSKVLIAALLSGLTISLYTSAVNRLRYADYIQNVTSQTSMAINDYGKLTSQAPDSLYIYWTYGTYSQCQSLQFGDNGTSAEITNDIKNICDHQRGISVWANRIKVFQKKWDIVITRTELMGSYPFLKDIGSVYKVLPGTENEFGSIVIIKNAK